MVDVGRAAVLRNTPVLVPVSVSVSDSTSPPERLVKVTVTVWALVGLVFCELSVVVT